LWNRVSELFLREQTVDRSPLRNGCNMDPAGSIIFDYGRAAAPVRGGRRIVPQAPTQTSVDNPLYFGPGGGVTHHSVIERTQNTAMERFENGPPPMQMPSWHAGKRSGADLPIGHKRTEKRTEYQHPNYQIHRSQHDTGVKDLLYSSASTAPTAPTAPMMAPPPLHGNHPIWPAYEFLASTMPTLPRDEDGNTQEGAALVALNACGLEISVDGLAELLARCDVAPEGFPPFSDFLLCLSRPHREHPPPELELQPPQPPQPPPSARVQDEFAQEAPYAQAKAAHFATSGPSAPHAVGYAPPAAYSEAQMKEQTWRHMQMQKQLATLDHHGPPGGSARRLGQPGPGPGPEPSRAALAVMASNRALSNPAEQMLRASVSYGTTARLGVAPPQPVSSFPLGTKSKATMLGANGPDPTKKVHATSQQFTNSFGPDPFFF
jgi:hypothetical protein